MIYLKVGWTMVDGFYYFCHFSGFVSTAIILIQEKSTEIRRKVAAWQLRKFGT